MEKFDIFEDIAKRTGGDIYLGVVGPVRSGKSTLVRRFMELWVLPHIVDENDLERARDALPQSGTGRQITTTEPKFIPDDGVEVNFKDLVKFRVRLVDCVGYAVPGASGYVDEEGPRMVDSPWFQERVPFEEAAEVGTRKVIADHSTVGILVTTDGSIGDIPRQDYVDAEQRVVSELKELGKPFVMVLNTATPYDQSTAELQQELEQAYDVPVLPLDAMHLTADDIGLLMEQMLYEFPVKSVDITLPDWVAELPADHWLRQRFEDATADVSSHIEKVRDIDAAVEQLRSFELVDQVIMESMDLGTGTATIATTAGPNLLYQVLGELSGAPVEGHADLVRQWRQMADDTSAYSVVKDALQEVRTTGYGLVSPSVPEMDFYEPELIRQGSRFGIRLRASAPSIHLLRTDVETEVTPLIGTEKQCEELMQYLVDRFEDDPAKLWESDIFGKSLSELVQEGIQNKLVRMPESVQEKLQETVQRIVNEGSGGLICIII